MTAAPNFAYNLFAKRLRRQAEEGQFDLSSLRWALSGAEQVDPADVEDLCEAGARVRAAARGDRARLRHGRDDGGGVVHRMRCGHGGRRGRRRSAGGAAPRRSRHARATPAAWLPGQADRRPGGPHRRRGRQRAARPRRRRHPGARQARHQGLRHDGRLHRAPRTRRAGTTPATWATSPRSATSSSAAGSRTSSSWRARTSTRPTSNAPPPAWPACVPDARSRCASTPALSRETFAVAVESNDYADPEQVRRIERQVAHEVFADVDVRPRNVVVLQPGVIPKTPSGKLRRAHALSLVN